MKKSDLIDQKRMMVQREIKRTCEKCGWTAEIPSYYDFVYCHNCGCEIYRTEKIKFKRKLLKEMGKGWNEQESRLKGSRESERN